jgi:hypothetical protein
MGRGATEPRQLQARDPRSVPATDGTACVAGGPRKPTPVSTGSVASRFPSAPQRELSQDWTSTVWKRQCWDDANTAWDGH